MRRLALALLALAACGERYPGPAPGAQPSASDPVQVVPGPGLPPEVTPQEANNNLDVVRHDGRVFLAFRTAPSHFASADVALYVVSSEDEQAWRFEGRITMQTDLREPRFLSWRGRLFLYFALLGTDSLNFEPRGMMVTEWLGPGQLGVPERTYEDGAIPWRTKVVGDVPYLVAYTGGENVYDLDEEPIRIHFLKTDDGRSWRAVVPGQPVVQEGGGSETDFVLMDDGALVAVTRNEAGDPAFGWGSKICRAEAGALGDWRCVADPRKYDSPLLFRSGSEIYLIARRNLTETGHYDLMRRDLGRVEQTMAYLFDYSSRPKRCSLWRVDPRSLAVTFVLDLASRGDTCFPGLVELGLGAFAVYNYSSPIEGPDLEWINGQLGETNIYRQVLRF